MLNFIVIFAKIAPKSIKTYILETPQVPEGLITWDNREFFLIISNLSASDLFKMEMSILRELLNLREIEERGSQIPDETLVRFLCAKSAIENEKNRRVCAFFKKRNFSPNGHQIASCKWQFVSNKVYLKVKLSNEKGGQSKMIIESLDPVGEDFILFDVSNPEKKLKNIIFQTHGSACDVF